ncbi:MAG: glycerol kinase GlpK [Lachnospiraceae bacterium]|nr:glycerol kinase GlpK [Lachnospiraceae bacterium]
MSKYILAVDQSTQGTKGLIFDEEGKLVCRADRPHEQIVNEKGWVEHDPIEILNNTIAVCRDVTEKSGIRKSDIVSFGISNQRETSVAWNKQTGRPVYNAIVWQCSRAEEICERHSSEAERIRKATGMKLSPYFPASKLQWIIEIIPDAEELAENNMLAVGTIDSWLIFNLTEEHNHKTDYSNASRTQLFDINKLEWDAELVKSFKLPMSAMPEVCMSDSDFGHTTLGGLLDVPVSIHGVLGDSHGALFGQDCRLPGQLKATYGTGSSVMMNIGTRPIISDKGIVTSLAWGMNGKVEYCFEGNLNYTGAVLRWLEKDIHLIERAHEADELAETANKEDKTYFVPAFTGLGAPYWDSKATGMFTGITRTTGRAEMAKACIECIPYQITDLIDLMREESGRTIDVIRADGGPTANGYMMQFQSDMSKAVVQIPELQELSGMGAAYAAGIAVGLYSPDEIFKHINYTQYSPKMDAERQKKLYDGWRAAVGQALHH